MQILVTNDDGVHAPGLAALVSALARWAADLPADRRPGITVVAPLANQSGASSAVGTVFERDSIPYRRIRLPGAPEVPAFGIDGSPALATIVGGLGAFGPQPDLVVSGINLGVNVGRSILHSGTVGATLTGAQMGKSGLAVSIRADDDPIWETAGLLAVSVLPVLIDAPPRTVLNLNVPSLHLRDLRGVRAARVGGAAVIKGASDPTGAVDDREPLATAVPSDPNALITDEHEGHLILRLGPAVPELGDVAGEGENDDAMLVARGYASLTPLVGVREDMAPEAQRIIQDALAAMPCDAVQPAD